VQQYQAAREDGERRYNARTVVPDYPVIFERWARESAEVRTHLRACGKARLDLAYGAHASETLDLFLPEVRPQGTLMYIHGGYWRSLDKSDASIVAPVFVAAGYAVAVVNYALCPAVTVEFIVQQMQRAAAWLHQHSSEWQAPSERVFACGHSAGGHLAAMLLATDWPELHPSLPTKTIAGAVCVSALYELQPLLQVPSVMQASPFTAASAPALSPALHQPLTDAPLLTALGLDENPGFHDQAQTIARCWPQVHAGHIACAGRNHFTILDELTQTGGKIATAALDLFSSLKPPTP
jgi:arylformamidase